MAAMGATTFGIRGGTGRGEDFGYPKMQRRDAQRDRQSR